MTIVSAGATILMPVGLQARDNVQIYPRAIKAHVEFLADDLLDGRDDGTPGHLIAANYVRAQWLAIGLRPAMRGSWFQNVPLLRRGSPQDVPAVLLIDSDPLPPEQALIFVQQEDFVDWSGEVLFAGYGVQKPEIGVNELKGLDVRGKVIAVFPNPPWRVGYGEVQRRLFEMGAAGVLWLPSINPADRYNWGSLRIDDTPALLDIADQRPADLGVQGWIGLGAARRLFAEGPLAFDDIVLRFARGTPIAGFGLHARARITGKRHWRRTSSPNVLGLIEGSDPVLRNEVVIVLAHLDHLGRRDFNAEDGIFNGALDNAAGVALLIEVARDLVSGKRPKRSLLFAATTAEEDGLLGSRYLALNMPHALGRPIAVVNLDMPMLTHSFTDVTAYGAEHSTVGKIVQRAARRERLKISEDPWPGEALFTRSDHFSFVQRGIPALFLQTGPSNGGAEEYLRYLRKHYHQTSDAATLPVDWHAAARFARLNALIVRELANARSAPLWFEDSQWGKQFAPHAIKARRAKNVPGT